jgi:hypothetical protein
MTANEKNIDREDVLFAFHRECERPTARQIIEWTERYPAFADDIRAHAAIALDMPAGAEDAALEPDATMLACGRSRALNAIHNARRAAAAEQQPTWDQMLAARNTTVPQLARTIDIERSVLAELAAGRMRLPIGLRLVAALTGALNAPAEWLESAATQLLASPRLGHAKANQPPVVNARSYREIILDSSMSDERQKFWLGED